MPLGLGNSGEDVTWTPTSCIGVLAEFFVLLLKNIFINLCVDITVVSTLPDLLHL